MKILITGAAGFIGGHLLNSLDKEFEVMGIDNGIAGNWNRLNRPSTVKQFDICTNDENYLRDLMRQFDTLIHLAALKHNSSINNPGSLMQTNVMATERLLRIAGELSFKRVIFTSSLYAYGSMGPKSMEVFDEPTPHTLYGLTKLHGEQLVRYYSNKYGFTYHLPRLFFIYGPNQFAEGGYKSVIVRNMESLLKDNVLTVVGSGQQELDYVYVDDAVEVLKRMLLLPHSTGLTNISSGVGSSINSIIKILSTKKPGVEIVNLPPDWTEGSRRVGSTAALQEKIGWIPNTDIETGLEKVWQSKMKA